MAIPNRYGLEIESLYPVRWGTTQCPRTENPSIKDAYQFIITTLTHDSADLKNVIKETIYCRDMDALIKCQDIRKKFYDGHLPAGTWVQVERLHSPEELIEIEVEAILP